MMTLALTGTARFRRRRLHRAGAERSGVLPLFGSLIVLTMLSPPAQAADVLNPLDFVDLTNTTVEAVRTGAYDASPAFIAAIESRPAGSNLRLVVPSGTYRLRFLPNALTAASVRLPTLRIARRDSARCRPHD